MASDVHGVGEGGRLRIALVCASNMNRSMEAHNMLLKKGFTVSSFGRASQCYDSVPTVCVGTGNQVRLPGPSIDRPNVYNFGTPYTKIFEDLTNKDANLYRSLRLTCALIRCCRYRQNGLLHMLERNMKIKNAPQRWQEQRNVFDVIITFEERVFDHIIEGASCNSVSRPHCLLALQTLQTAAPSHSNPCIYST